jgi:hypothetical protein
MLANAFFGIQLAEVPDKDELITITGPAGSPAYSEIFTAPASGQYRIDYEYPDGQGTAYVEFNSADDGLQIEVSYHGKGTPWKGDIFNELSTVQPFFPYFGGDESDGDITISTPTEWSAVPRQCRDLTITDDLAPALGVQSIIIGCTRRLTLAAGTINAGARGAMHPAHYAGLCPMGSYGGGGGGSNSPVNWGWGGGRDITGLLAHIGDEWNAIGQSSESGFGGQGAISTGTPLPGKRNIPVPGVHWKSLRNRLAVGMAGGYDYTVSAGDPGGSGGGIILVECAELDITGASFIWSQGEGGFGGNAGAGAGGTISVITKRIISDTASWSVAGGTGSGDGGDGSDGYGALVCIREGNFSVTVI